MYKLNNIEFTSKNKVRQYVQDNILKQYPVKHDLSNDHLEVIKDLLQHHPNREHKLGSGVKRVWLQPNKFNHKEFWLERTDGSITDFSYLQCLTPSKKLNKVKQAMRRSIEWHVWGFREDYFKNHAVDGLIDCPILGIKVDKYHAEVDHIAPDTFDAIANDFIKDYIPDLENVPITNNVDGLIGVEFTDKELEKKWYFFHLVRAKLRVISTNAHRRLKSLG